MAGMHNPQRSTLSASLFNLRWTRLFFFWARQSTNLHLCCLQVILLEVLRGINSSRRPSPRDRRACQAQSNAGLQSRYPSAQPIVALTLGHVHGCQSYCGTRRPDVSLYCPLESLTYLDKADRKPGKRMQSSLVAQKFAHFWLQIKCHRYAASGLWSCSEYSICFVASRSANLEQGIHNFRIILVTG